MILIIWAILITLMFRPSFGYARYKGRRVRVMRRRSVHPVSILMWAYGGFVHHIDRRLGFPFSIIGINIGWRVFNVYNLIVDPQFRYAVFVTKWYRRVRYNIKWLSTLPTFWYLKYRHGVTMPTIDQIIDGAFVEKKRARQIQFGLLLLVGMLGLPFILGTTYYVDPTGGSDSNSGTAQDAAWQTDAKVTGTNFSAGDYILYKAGTTLTHTSGTYMVYGHNSGSSGSPITFGKYGTGDNPKIDGEDAVQTLTAIVNVSYVTITDLDLRGATGTFSAVTDNSGYSYSNIIDSCSITGSVNGRWTTFQRQSGSMIVDCTATATGGGGNGFYGAPTGDSPNISLTFSGNTWNGGGYARDGISVHYSQSVGSGNGEGMYVYNNSGYGCAEQNLDATDAWGWKIYGNYFYDNSEQIAAGHYFGYGESINHICFNRLYGYTGASYIIHLQGDHTRIYCNLIKMGSGTVKAIELSDEAITNDGPDDTAIYFNTLVANNGGAAFYFATAGVNGGEMDGDCIIKNNVATYITAAFTNELYFSSSVYSFTGGSESGTLTSDYNYWRGDFTAYQATGDVSHNFATWQGTDGQDTHGINSATDPCVDSTGETSGWPDDAKLPSSSTCIEAATPINSGTFINTNGTNTTGLTVDYYGTARDGTSPDIGFHEKDSGAPPEVSYIDEMWLEDGDVLSLDSGDTLTASVYVQSGGTIRNTDDNPAIKPIISGNVYVYTGGTAGHTGGVANSITVTGSKLGSGTFKGEFLSQGEAEQVTSVTSSLNTARVVNASRNLNANREFN